MEIEQVKGQNKSLIDDLRQVNQEKQSLTDQLNKASKQKDKLQIEKDESKNETSHAVQGKTIELTSLVKKPAIVGKGAKPDIESPDIDLNS